MVRPMDPASTYRDLFRQVLRDRVPRSWRDGFVPPGMTSQEVEAWVRETDRLLGSDAALRDWLEAELQRATDRLGRHLVAAALLTFGHLHRAFDVLDTMPDPPAHRGGLGKVGYFGSNALRALLPLPDELRGHGGWYALVDVDGVRAWLTAHADRLVWSEAAGAFAMSG